MRSSPASDPRPEYVLSIRPRTVLTVALVLLGVVALVKVILMSERVLIWIFVSVLLAMALNPAVDALLRHGVRRRGVAAGLVYMWVAAFIAGVAALIIPTLVQQVSDFIQAVPGYVKQLTAGQGPLGFLETKYDVVERVQAAVDGNGAATTSLAGGADAALDVTRSVATFVAGVITITFLTLFMLLEGPQWVKRTIELLPARMRAEAHSIADDIYQLIGRYVTGNLLISLMAGTATTILLLALGVPYALALGLLVAVLDLIPLAGATLAAIVVSLVAFTDSSTSGIVVLVFMIVYQQIENHLIQPLVYGRTIALSPLAILISVLIGAEVAGVLGALVAIPVGGTIQILLAHWLEHRRRREVASEAYAAGETDPQAPPGGPAPAGPSDEPPAAPPDELSTGADALSPRPPGSRRRRRRRKAPARDGATAAR
jgi:predicted PurR-regulated permease PerM